MTVAFYVHNDDRDKVNIKSTIKFGSIDRIALKNENREMQVMRTRHKGTWDLRCKELKLDTGPLGSWSTIRFEPQLPYLYLAKNMFQKFKKDINDRYGMQKDKDGEDVEVCPEDQNYCKFNKICSQVDHNVNKNFMFNIYDETGDFPFYLDWSQMFMSGNFFGDSPSTCYLAVFDHGLNGGQLESALVIVGNIFTRHYYVVYDMSPLEYGHDYI